MNRLGRNRPTRVSPHHSLARYITTPAPPASVDYTAAATENLTNIYGNNVLGDCTAACYAHQIGLWTGNSGTLFVPTIDDVVTFYSKCSGYQPGLDATDQGADELVVLDMARDVGLSGHVILGAITVDAMVDLQVATALWLFGGLTICVELPVEWSTNPSDGFTWDVEGSPDPKRGHCFLGTGYNSVGVQIDSWGIAGTVTWGAMQKYAIAGAGGSCNALLSRDWISTNMQTAPNGFDMAILSSDFASIGPEVT